MTIADDLLSPWRRSGEPFTKNLVTWYQQHKRDWPWRSKFAEHGDPYFVWISEIMLQQTTIQAVLPAYLRFLEVFPNVYQLARGTEEEIRQACRGLGYYRRFRMMHEAAGLLTQGLSKESDRVPWPTDFRSWKELPGIGDYTAAAISSIAFGYPKAVVDGNVERVFCRLFNLQVVPSQQWKKVFQEVGDSILDPQAPSDFNQGLMELGQSICLKQNPRCSQCPVRSHCQAFTLGTQHLAPAPKAPSTYEDVRIQLFILEKRGRLGLLERSRSARFLKGNWSFPSAIEQPDRSLSWETAAIPTLDAKRIGSVKHSITRHRIEVVVSSLACHEDMKGLRWVSEGEVEKNLVSNLDRKALHLYWKRRTKAPLESFFGH